MTDARPVGLVTSTVTDYRVEPFRLLAEAEQVEVLAWADPGSPVAGVAVRAVSQAQAGRLVAQGRYRAVVCGLGGRLALPGTYLAARARGVPFVLWASLWAHPRTPSHVLSYVPTRHLYRHADAVVTYGPHVTDYVAARRGARDRVFEAIQAVDPEVFSAPIPSEQRAAARQAAGAEAGQVLVLFVGRLVPEKGVPVLLEAWRRAPETAVLALAGEGPMAAEAGRAGGRVRALGRVSRERLPALYAAADLLVLPSVPTATFLEPWGLVVNEAMHQGTPVLATDAVGAEAGGLVRHRRNGLVVPAGDPRALADALRTVIADPELRRRLGEAAREDVRPYRPVAWAEGVRAALSAVGAGR